MLKYFETRIIPLLLIFVSLFASSAHAAEDARYAKTVINSLKYVRGLDSNKYDIVIVYQSGDAASQDEAKNLVNIFKGMSKIKSVKKQSLGNVSAANNSLLFVTSGLEKHYAEIQSIVKAKKLFPVSSQTSCVKSSACVLAFTSGKRLNIFLNTQNLYDYGFDVEASFNFMVKKV